ncbi:hypothetical protein ACFQX7_36150 [Luedemannella flava]
MTDVGRLGPVSAVRRALLTAIAGPVPTLPCRARRARASSGAGMRSCCTRPGLRPAPAATSAEAFASAVLLTRDDEAPRGLPERCATVRRRDRGARPRVHRPYGGDRPRGERGGRRGGWDGDFGAARTERARVTAEWTLALEPDEVAEGTPMAMRGQLMFATEQRARGEVETNPRRGCSDRDRALHRVESRSWSTDHRRTGAVRACSPA